MSLMLSLWRTSNDHSAANRHRFSSRYNRAPLLDVRQDQGAPEGLQIQPEPTGSDSPRPTATSLSISSTSSGTTTNAQPTSSASTTAGGGSTSAGLSSNFLPSSSSTSALNSLSSSSLPTTTSTLLPSSDTSASSSFQSSSSSVVDPASLTESSSALSSSSSQIPTSSEFPQTSSSSSLTASDAERVQVTSTPSSISEQSILSTSTLVLVPSASEADVSASSSLNSVPTDVGAVSSNDGFWSNKSAVVGTFSAVSIVIVASLLGLVICVIRRRKRANADLPVWQEKYPEPEVYPDAPRESASPGGMSSVEMHQHQPPMDAFGLHHDMYYPHFDTSFYDAAGSESSHGHSSQGTHPSFSNTQTNVYLPPPPSIMLSLAADSSRSVQDPFRDPTPTVGQNSASPYPSSTNSQLNINDSNATNSVDHLPSNRPMNSTTIPPPVSFSYGNIPGTPTLIPPSPVDRVSYQPSIDSFYGGAYAR